VPVPADPIRLQLELDSPKDPIQGRVSDRDAEPIPFTGWLELMAAVHRLTGTRPDATVGPSSDGDTGQAR
jgi:hypothetical protein